MARDSSITKRDMGETLPRDEKRRLAVVANRVVPDLSPANMIPLSLPKANDFWRGKKIGPTVFGSRVLGIGQESRRNPGSEMTDRDD